MSALRLKARSGRACSARPAMIAGIVGVVLLAACDSPTVPPRLIAYQFAYEGFVERVIYRWPDGQTIGVHVAPTGETERDALLEAAFRHTAQAWNDAVLYGEYRLEAAPLQRADVILAWANHALPIDTSECPPSPDGFAWTTFCANSTGTAIAAYPLTVGQHVEDGVHMIVQVLQTELEPDPDRVAALVAHEFGHVLGIGTHPCRLSDSGCTRRQGAHESLMYLGIPERSTPSAADRSTIELLYHTRPDLTP